MGKWGERMKDIEKVTKCGRDGRWKGDWKNGCMRHRVG